MGISMCQNTHAEARGRLRDLLVLFRKEALRVIHIHHRARSRARRGGGVPPHTRAGDKPITVLPDGVILRGDVQFFILFFV